MKLGVIRSPIGHRWNDADRNAVQYLCDQWGWTWNDLDVRPRQTDCAIGGQSEGDRMAEIFSEELISSQEDEGYYTPQKLAKLKLIFERACLVAGISPELGLQRDEMAMLILVGSKIYKDEEMLVQAALRVIVKSH
jgi:hypothetical protein